MSRKDMMKKSLGIPEYPWSSDDELDEVMAPEEASTRRPTSEPCPSVAEDPGTSSNSGGSTNPPPPRPQSGPQQSGSQPSRSQPSRTHQSGNLSSRSQQSGHQQSSHQQSGIRLPISQQSGSRQSGSQPYDARRNQERIDEDLYWTILNAPHIVNSSTGSREPYSELPAFLSRVSHTPAQELRERGERPTASDMQRILAFKRLTRNLASKSLRRGPVTGLIPVSRVNPGMVVPSEATSSIRISRMLPRRRYYRSPPSGSGSGSARTGGSLSPRSSRSRREHESSTPRPAPPLDAGEAQRPTIPAQNISDEAHPEQEVILEATESADTTTAGEELEPEGSAADTSDPPEAPAAEDVSSEEPSPPVEYPTPVTDPNLASVGQTAEADLPLPQGNYSGTKRKHRDSEDNGEPCTVKEFNQNLLRLLECPVCLEWMEPPMSQCRRGHLVCGRCRARLNCCPVCRTAFSSVRNRAMEGVAEMVRYPCRHGCGREVRLRRRAPHEASCAARKYLCPAPLCATAHPLPRDQLHLHFQSPKPEPGATPLVEGESSEQKDTEEEKTLLFPDTRKRGDSILRQLLSARGTNERLNRALLIRRSLMSAELSRQFVPGLPGGRPPPERDTSGPPQRPLGPGRPYLEALRRLAVNIANEPEGGAGPAQQHASPGAPPYFPPRPVGPHVGGPHNLPPNAGPNYFPGMPDMPLPYGIRHEMPVGPRPNMFPPNGQRPILAQQVHDVLHQGNGANNGNQSKHLPIIKIGQFHKFSMKVNIEQHDNWLVFAMDEYFHLRIDVDIRTWGVVVYVSYIGPKCDAKNYTYSVTVDGQHNSRKITYMRATHSDLESSSLNVTRQDCFHLTLDQALNFIRFKNRHCDTDKFLDFNLEIAKVESTSARDESDS